jgi:hypothetical protein
MGATIMRSNRRPTGKRTSNNKEFRTTNLKDQLLLGSRLQLIEHAVPLGVVGRPSWFSTLSVCLAIPPARGDYEGQPPPPGAAAATAAAF